MLRYHMLVCLFVCFVSFLFWFVCFCFCFGVCVWGGVVYQYCHALCHCNCHYTTPYLHLQGYERQLTKNEEKWRKICINCQIWAEVKRKLKLLHQKILNNKEISWNDELSQNCNYHTHLIWPDCIESVVKRLFLASRKFSRNFLSSFCNTTKQNIYPQL